MRTGLIFLTIKGTPHDAQMAAADRGIPIEIVDELPGWRSTLATTKDKYRAQVGGWFNLASGPAPYPEGTLLFFNDMQMTPWTQLSALQQARRVSEQEATAFQDWMSR